MIQPLFPHDDDHTAPPSKDEGYVLHNRHGRKLQPLSQELIAPHTAAPQYPNTPHDGDNPAVALIRQKVEALYADEPAAQQEIAAVPAAAPQRTRHQQFMYELSTSGKSLAQIQTEWHNYYLALPDAEKHMVWQEFYAANRQPQYGTPQPAVSGQAAVSRLPALPSAMRPAAHQPYAAPQKPDTRTSGQIKKHLLKRVSGNAKAHGKAKQHLQSLAFGLVSAVAVLAIFFFSFFNEMIITPFIQPSRHVSATPIIVDADSVAPNETPEIIIPKINVQIPVVYDEPSMEEAKIQSALERGVVHYPITSLPGQQGNAAVFGHSSNNIFNKGKYKFAFVFLRELVPGDLFYLTYDKKVYAYRVFEKRVVAPTEISVLNAVPGKTATATLITCDPPGTSTNRLVVWGEQISPDPASATSPITPPTVEQTPAELPSEGPTLWNRFTNWLF